MRYKAYYNKTDIAHRQPDGKLDNYDLTPIDEDDDLHILQYRIREKSKDNGGLLYIQQVKIIDTLFEDKFVKKQEEIRQGNSELIEQSLYPIIKQFENKIMTIDEIQHMKQIIANSISQNPIINMTVGDGEIFIKYIGQNTYELNLPSYNIGPIKFSL